MYQSTNTATNQYINVFIHPSIHPSSTDLSTYLLLPSMDPSVPSSAIMNWNTWSALLRIIAQISWKFTHRVFFVPTISNISRTATTLEKVTDDASVGN